MKKDTTTYGAKRPAWDKNDCAVRALAVACGVSYATASAVYSARGRRLKAGTEVTLSAELCEQILEMKRVTLAEGLRLEAFLEVAKTGSYMVRKAGHMFAVVEGVVHDWQSTTRENTKILGVWKVTEQARARMRAMAELLG